MHRDLFAYFIRSSLYLLSLLLIAGVIIFFIIEPAEVDGRSMENTYTDGDLIFIEKVSLLTHPPVRGQVVSFLSEVPGTLNIKRVIGLPGEQIKIRNGKIYIKKTAEAEFELTESYLALGTRTLPLDGVTATYPELQVNEYFLLGDNRADSDDSRLYGPIERQKIIGVVRW